MSVLERTGRVPDREARRLDREANVLLVDIGNTRIKWAIWSKGQMSPMRADAHAGWTRRHYERRIFARGTPTLSRIIVASVAGTRVDHLFEAAAWSAAAARPEFIETSRLAAGVTTRYVDPWRLGVDRFVGAIAAHELVRPRGVCVVNAGTTVTIDLVDGTGVHRGGAILPGPSLMVQSLLDSTAGIERRAREGSLRRRGGQRRSASDLFARSTKSAIRQGALYAVAALIDRAVAEARERLGTAPWVLLSGGGAEQLEPLIQSRHVRVADLVLRGIAVHAGLAMRKPFAKPKARALPPTR